MFFGKVASSSILRRGRVATLKQWIKEAENAGITAISRFVGQLKRDQRAVENAVAYGWSHGPVEGHINRLKAVKRVRTSWIRAASLTDSALGALSNCCTKPAEEPTLCAREQADSLGSDHFGSYGKPNVIIIGPAAAPTYCFPSST
jgi:Transposase